MMVTATPKELRPSQISEWLDDLAALGADTAPLAAVAEQVGIIRRLTAEKQHLRKQMQFAPSPLKAAAQELASGGEYDVDGTRQKILSSADLHAKIDVYEKAIDDASGKAWAQLTRRRTSNLDLLRPAYMNAAAEMLAAREVLGSERVELADAARRGNAEQWLRLEAGAKTIRRIREIHNQWLADGVIENRGARSRKRGYGSVWDQYSVSEIFYEDRMIAHTARNDDGMFHLANLFAAAGPALRTIPQVDDEWSTGIVNAEYASQAGKAITGKETHWDAAKLQARAAWEASTGTAIPGTSTFQ